MVKCKIKKSQINESSAKASRRLQIFESMADEIKKAEELYDRIANGLGIANTEINKRYKDNHSHSVNSIDVSKIDEVVCVDPLTNTKVNVPCKKVANLAEIYKNDMLHVKGLDICAKYWAKPIIWTFDVATAATDGIRLVMNPAFALNLYGMAPDGAAFKFVLVHEGYHMIYDHMRRTMMHPEASHDLELSNVAQDAEINRDILFQYQSIYPGFNREVLKATGGVDMIDKYPNQSWEYIFDDLKKTGFTTPRSQVNNSQSSSSSSSSQQNNNCQSGNCQSGNQGQNQSQNNNQQSGQRSGSGPSDLQNKSQDYIKGYKKALEDYAKGIITTDFLNEGLDMMFESANLRFPNMSEDYNKGYEDALKAIKNLEEQAKNLNSQKNSSQSGQSAGNQQNQNSNSDSGNQGGQQENSNKQSQSSASGNSQNGEQGQNGGFAGLPSEITTNIDGHGLEGNDLIPTEVLQKIAERAGQPYDNNDLKENPIKKADQLRKDHEQELRSIGKNQSSKSYGSGVSMSEVLDKITELLKPKINWRTQIKRLMQGVVDAYDIVNLEMHKNRLPFDWRGNRYSRVKETISQNLPGFPQIFYLIDNSGSMGSPSNIVFTQIFSEIIDLEKRCKVLRSNLTYFSAGKLRPQQIREWKISDSKGKIMSLIPQNSGDMSGGTDILRAIKDVYELPKKYFNAVTNPKSLLIVFTDGEDGTTLDAINKVDTRFKKRTVVCIINDKRRAESYAKMYEEGGFYKAIVIDQNEI